MTTITKLPIRGTCPVCQESRVIRTSGLLSRHTDLRHTEKQCKGTNQVPEFYLYTMAMTPRERQILVDALEVYASNAVLQNNADTAQRLAESFDRSRKQPTVDDAI